jgi:hypothetical protein
MRATLVIAGSALAVLAAASLIAILFVEPSPPPPAAEPAAILPEVAAAVAAAKETAVKEAAAKQAAAESAAREQTVREAAARIAAAEAAAKDAAAKDAAAKDAAAAAAKELAVKDADALDGGAAPPPSTPGAVAAATWGANAGTEPHQNPPREGRSAAIPPGTTARSREQLSAAAITARLDELKPRLSQCYEGAERAAANPAAGSPGTASDRPVSPVFMVELESAGEHYRVVDADVDSRGGAEDGVLECMRTVLVGATISIPGAENAERVTLRFSP